MIKETKKWRVKTLEGKNIYFHPVFLSDIQSGEVTCDKTILKIDDKEYTINHDLLLMYCYTISNEEQRRKLLNLYQRKVHYIPYEISIKLDKNELQSGIAKRRIQLPVDELAINYAKNEGLKMMIKHPLKFMFGK